MTFQSTGAGDTGAQDTQTTGTTPAQGNPDQGTQGAAGGDLQADFDKLVKRHTDSQDHIANIERENAKYRETLAELEERLNATQGKLAATKSVEDIIAGMQTSTETQTQGQEIDTEELISQITEKVTSDLDAKVQKELQDSNYQKVAAVLNSTFGDKTDDHITKVAQDNGMTYEEAEDVARNNPKLFENLFIKPFSQQQKQSAAPTIGGQNTSAAQGQGTQLTQEYWTNLRRTEPHKYWSKDVQAKYWAWFDENK